MSHYTRPTCRRGGEPPSNLHGKKLNKNMLNWKRPDEGKLNQNASGDKSEIIQVARFLCKGFNIKRKTSQFYLYVLFVKKHLPTWQRRAQYNAKQMHRRPQFEWFSGFLFCLPKMSDSVHRVLLSLLPFTTSVFDPQKQN